MIVVNSHSVGQFCFIIDCSEYLFSKQFDNYWESFNFFRPDFLALDQISNIVLDVRAP